MNARTTEDIFKIIPLDGEEYMFYKSFPVDADLIRGTNSRRARQSDRGQRRRAHGNSLQLARRPRLPAAL
jgi:acyl CoA:acetate/3-ketoacid CoA transferase